MLKYIVCLIAGTLLAETIDHVEFQFPPSNYEWKELIGDQALSDLFDWDDEDGDAVENLKAYTHREGDALEILVVMTYSGIDQEAAIDNEVATLEAIQEELDLTVNKIFPNHRYMINAYVPDEGANTAFVEWELNDGTQELLHGFARAFSSRNGDNLRTATLCYLTTANKSEHNSSTWTEVLNQARILN